LSLEGTVGNIGAGVVHERHNRLVLSAVPLHVARLSENVSPCGLVVHVEHWVLACSPLAVCVGHWGVLGQHARHIPVEQVGVVSQSLSVEGVVVHHNGSVVSQTAAKTSDNEPHAPNVRKAASSVEVFNWQFTDHRKTESNTDLSAGGVVSPVEVGAVDGSSNLVHLTAGEPRSKEGELTLGLGSPGGHRLLKSVLGHTEANKVVVLNVLSNLGVNLSSLEIIIGVLLLLTSLPARPVVHLGVIKRDFVKLRHPPLLQQ